MEFLRKFKMSGVSVFLICIALSSQAADSEKGPHGGKVFKAKKGQSYEVVTQETSKEMKVYTTTVSEPLPNEMVIKVVPIKGPLSRIKLQLNQKDANESYYSGIVPANVSISGGVKFEFEFMKKKSLPAPVEHKESP